jgi:hypothetical protein
VEETMMFFLLLLVPFDPPVTEGGEQAEIAAWLESNYTGEFKLDHGPDGYCVYVKGTGSLINAGFIRLGSSTFSYREALRDMQYRNSKWLNDHGYKRKKP